MSGRPDHAAARWADEGVEEAPERVPAGSGRPEDALGADAGSADGEADAGSRTDPESEDEGSSEPGEGPILADVAALTAQRDEYLDSLQRLKADFDNYRKRVARLQQEQSARAEANLVSKLLPVLDNLDLAWAHLGPSGGGGEPVSEEARAIGQARAQMLDILGREGLERVDAVSVPFDPTVHDAVAHAAPDAADGPGEPAPGADEPVTASQDEQRSTAPGPGGEAGGGEAGGPGPDAAAPDVPGAPGAPGAAGAGAAPGAPSAAPGAPSAAQDPQVVSVEEVLRAGYRWRGQVLRPAMVRVRG